jgi:hypothetical protein
LTDVTAKLVISESFMEGKLEAPKHLASTVHDLYFEPRYEEFKLRTIWSLSNVFTSAFKELHPIPNLRLRPSWVNSWRRSFLGIPAIRGGTVVAMIGLANRKNGYTEAERARIQRMTPTLAVLYDCYISVGLRAA